MAGLAIHNPSLELLPSALPCSCRSRLAGTSAFLKAHDCTVALGQGQRKRQVRVGGPVRAVFRRQTEIAVKGVLRVKVDTPVLK